MKKILAYYAFLVTTAMVIGGMYLSDSPFIIFESILFLPIAIFFGTYIFYIHKKFSILDAIKKHPYISFFEKHFLKISLYASILTSIIQIGSFGSIHTREDFIGAIAFIPVTYFSIRTFLSYRKHKHI